MKKDLLQTLVRSSIEDASVLRQFTVFFFLMSIIPIGILFYLYSQVQDTGQISLAAFQFRYALIFAVIGVGVGYWYMRTLLKRLIKVTQANRNALEVVLGPQKIRELSHEKNEIAVLARSFSEVTTRLEENIRNLEIAKKTLHSVLSRVGEGISSMQNIDSFLELIVETATEAFVGTNGVLMLMDDDDKKLFVNSVYCSNNGKTERGFHLNVDTYPFSTIISSRQPAIVDSLHDEQKKLIGHNKLFLTPMLCAPLVLHEKTLGVIAVCGKEVAGETFAEDEKNLIYNLGLQTAVAVENSKLNEDAEKTYFETISALALAVDARDKYSRGHLDRVAEHVVLIGKELGLSEKDLKTLHDAARLHDVGKIGIPDEVLIKPTQLTAQEMNLMKKHAEIGESIIKPIHSLQHLGDIIRHHHEKLDGSGYPDGLKGKQIGQLVRITTIADIYDALTTNRPYRKRFSHQKATEIMRDMGEKIDQKIFEIFIKAIEKKRS